MKKFNCRKATISDIKRSKEKILAFISTMEISSGAKKHKMLKQELHENVEKATYLWFLQECTVAKELLYQDRSWLTKLCSSTAGFMAWSLWTVSK